MTTTDRSTSIAGKLQCDVIVVGAGLAGLAAAISIQRTGHRVTVLERMPVLQEIGAGIQLSPNATILLEDWGVLDALRLQAFQPVKTFIRSYRGGMALATQEHSPTTAEQDQAPYLLIHRANLHTVLRERAESLGAQIVLNASIADIDLEIAKPSIRLQTGEIYQADIILGADGERSTCREEMLGLEPCLRSSGNLIYRFSVPVSKAQEQEALADLLNPTHVNLWMGPESHAVSYVVKRDNLLNVALSVPQGLLDKTQYGVQVVAVQELCEILAEWDVRIGKLLSLTDHCSKWSLLQCDDIEAWTHSTGKFTLLGDSAHTMFPTLAQGASQCFEDAAVLGTLLGQVQRGEQLDDILFIYESLRKPRAKEVKKQSAEVLRVFCLPNGLEQQNRDSQLTEPEPSQGYPVILMDPVFRRWLWGYNANTEALHAWEKYLHDKTSKNAN